MECWVWLGRSVWRAKWQRINHGANIPCETASLHRNPSLPLGILSCACSDHTLAGRRNCLVGFRGAESAVWDEAV